MKTRKLVCVCVCVCVIFLLAHFLVSPASAKPLTNPASPQTPQVTKSRIQATFLRAPLHFEANQGQTDEQVKFLARGSGYTLFLTSTESVLVLREGRRQPEPGESGRLPVRRNPKSKTRTELSRSIENPKSAVVRMKLVGANSDAKVAGLDQLPGKVNYFIGNDPKKWRTNISTYKRVEYKDVYPGVNLVFYGNQRQLEYDFVVSPGADPSVIQLAFEGSDKIDVDSKGDLILRTALGDLRLHKPLVYQEVAGARKAISASYVLVHRPVGEGKGEGKQEVIFQLALYDATKPLVIDPVLSYSTYLGGSSADAGFSIAVDTMGNAYVSGFANSTNFPAVNPYQANLAGIGSVYGDAFVAKLDSTGNIVYSTYLGGSSNDRSRGIAVDAYGNAYVTGSTDSLNFPVLNAFQANFGGGTGDVFVAKFDPTGSVLYSTYLGGSRYDFPGAIAVDKSGNAFVAGVTSSTDFPTTLNSYQPRFGGSIGPVDAVGDAFVTKFDPGGRVIYSTYLGGSGDDVGLAIAIDFDGNAHVTGYTRSLDFPTANPFQASLRGSDDVFVTKLNAAGNALLYSTYLGGSGSDAGNAIAVDCSGNAYVTGDVRSLDFPTANPFQASHGGGVYDGFVAKLNPTGNALVYSTYLGGSGQDRGLAIAVDCSGSAYVTGFTESGNFPTANPSQAANAGGSDVFVTMLNPAGSALIYSTYLGGSGDEGASGIAVDISGGVYITGGTTSADFPTATPYQGNFGGAEDGYVAKIECPGPSFHDDFNRADSPTVGNGWLDSPNNSGGNLSIRAGQLTPSAIGGYEGIYRPLTFGTAISVSATLAESSGYGGLPRQYSAEFTIRSDGTLGTGYRLAFSRSDINYNDSKIGLYDGAVLIAQFTPSIQFGPLLDLNFTFNVDGSVIGTVTQNGQSESFSFPAHTIQSSGPYFLIALAGPDGRATTNPTYHRLDDLTISGTCSTNVAPTVGTISAPVAPVQVNTAITASAPFTDPGTSDTHTAVWSWGDGTTSSGTVTETNGSGSVTGSHVYATAGVYTVTLTVTDDDGDSGQSVFQFVVVFDPSAGFVTGGGWINSPAGAYAADPSLTGKANFGFVSRYRPGATVPEGQTEFRFSVANLNFHSSNYEWLVVGGARAQYKGTGTINGTGSYNFILTAIDGQVAGGGGIDKFRIKIWSSGGVIYDNQMGAGDDANPTTQLGGGSIVIHTQ